MAYTPITWQNISAPNLTDVANILGNAQKSFNNALSSVGDVVKMRNATEDSNWQAQKAVNTNNFMSTVLGANTVDDYKKLQESGTLKNLLSGAGAQIDSAAAMKAMDERMGTLQQRGLTAIDYNNKTLDNEQAPLRDQIASLTAQGKTGEALALANAHNELRNRATLFQGIDTKNQDLVNRDRATTEFGWKTEMHPLDIAAKQAGIDASRTSTALHGVQLKTAQNTLADQTETRKLEGILAQAASQNVAEKAALGQVQGRYAAANGLTVNSQGLPDFENYTKDQMIKFNEVAKKNGIPGSAEYLTGDTKRANSLFETLTKSSGISPRILKANEQNIRGVFNTSITANTPTGNDALKAATDTASNKVMFDRLDEANWYAPGSENARKQYEKLATQITPTLKGMSNGIWFGDNTKDADAIQKMLGEVASVGLKNKNGEMVTPSANDVMRFIRDSNTRINAWTGFTDSGRADAIKSALQEWIDTPEALKMQMDGLASQKFQDNERKAQLIRETLYPKK